MSFFRRILYVLSVLTPLALLIDCKAVFYPGIDWNNNLWLIAYFGEYFRQHWVMPTELNALSSVGMATPLFYGYLLYPMLGFFATFVGAAIALRLGCLMMVSLQFYALMCAGRVVFRHRGLTYSMAVTAIWSTYALTNLYNRSAIPEFFATGFLMTTIGFAVAAAAETGASRRSYYVWMTGLSAILTIGTHPPTAVVSGVFLSALGVLLAGTWAWKSRSRLRSVMIMGFCSLALIVVILTPWFYLTMRIGPNLLMWANPFTLLFYPDRSDSLLGRLSPSPYDWLSARWGTLNVSTPYLEAPIAFGSLILLAWLLIIWARSPLRPDSTSDTLWTQAAALIVPTTLTWFCLLFAISLSHPLATHFLFLGPYLQYAYRLVSHLNAALMVSVFAAAALARNRGALTHNMHRADILAAVCITMAGMTLVMKLCHASTVSTEQTSPEYTYAGNRAPVIVQGRQYLAEIYSTPIRVSDLPDNEAQNTLPVAFSVVASGRGFGHVSTIQIHVDRPTWLVTNVIVFPWNHIWVNGVKSSGNDLRRHGSFLAVRVPPGIDNLRWEWHPDPIWFTLHIIAQIAFTITILITLCWLFTGIWHRTS